HTTGVSVAAGSAHFPAALSTPRTRDGVIGASRSRTPVASKNALAPPAGTGDSAGSPEPVVREPGPCGSGTSVRLSPWMYTFGASLKRTIGYDTQSRLVTCLLLNTTASWSARERPCMAAPSSLFSLPPG